MSAQLEKDFCLKPVKIIRDLVHEYINLTAFELKLIDTVPFQRLKDVRQLTCQHVYPCARHTRFEHSLGVMQLTKQAIKYLKQNGMLEGDGNIGSSPVIDDRLALNATVAALLHDVGHCPFSHLGEGEFDREAVRERLVESMRRCNQDTVVFSEKLIAKINKKNARGIGAVHEQLSCIVIIEKYREELIPEIARKQPDATEGKAFLELDYELIVRSILGIQYNDETADEVDKFKMHNVVIGLINSSIFDMDKLDYIMRDSFYTGISTPTIDTKRLFRSMYLGHDFSLVFTSKAVSTLQNMIDARDELYLYVYNHHAVVFSDFVNTYILRKLEHNCKGFFDIACPSRSKEEREEILSWFQISRLGMIPRPYLFSVESVVEQNRSDSDWISLLNIMLCVGKNTESDLESLLNGEIAYFKKELRQIYGVKAVSEDVQPLKSAKGALMNRIVATFELISKYHRREFLKPWWKTVFEFTNFMQRNFNDDAVRRRAGELICAKDDDKFNGSEFRSQIAKHVIYITQQLIKESNKTHMKCDLLEELRDGDFFIIQRAPRFFDLDTIEKLAVALKPSEIVGVPSDINYQTSKYYVKFLTNIIPQKDYSAIYAKEGFYVFSRPIQDGDAVKKQRHYQEIERIFVFVLTNLIKKGVHWFKETFDNADVEKEKASKENFYKMYVDGYYR